MNTNTNTVDYKAYIVITPNGVSMSVVEDSSDNLNISFTDSAMKTHFFEGNAYYLENFCEDLPGVTVKVENGTHTFSD